MSISSKHHFLPQFYLKGFANSCKQFYIYLTKKNEFKKNGRLFSASSHFYISDDNTFEFEGEKDDFIEKAYAKSDSEIAKLFKKFQSSLLEVPPLTDLDFVLLEYFIARLFWRLPARKQQLEKLARERKLKELGIIFRDTETNDVVEEINLENRIKESGNLPLMLKSLFPNLFYPLLLNQNSSMKIFNFPPNLPGFISDNPLIMKNNDSFGFYMDDFILPLTPNKIIVRASKIKPQVLARVKVEIDMYILMQAKDYAASTDLSYPILMKNVFDNDYGTLENLKNSIFNKIIE